MTDVRHAKTLDEAAKNPDGTYNGIKALAWLSEAINPGHGIPEAEVRQMATEAIEKEKKRKKEATSGTTKQ